MSCKDKTMLFLCAAFFFMCSKTGAEADYSTSANHSFYDRYADLDKELQRFVKDQVKRLLPTALEVTAGLNFSSSCVREAFILMRGLRDLKLWALTFLDASGKISDGLLSGNIYSLGDFDQCLSAKVLDKNGAVDFKGKYCSVVSSLLLPNIPGSVGVEEGLGDFKKAMANSSDVLKLLASRGHIFTVMPSVTGICVPSGCTEEDIDQLVNHLGKKVMFNATVSSCQVDDPNLHLDTRRIVILFIFCFFVCLGIFASFLELYLQEKSTRPKDRLIEAVLCFSIVSNFKKVIDTDSGEKKLLCLNGIKVLTLLYVIMCHEHVLIVSLPRKRQSVFIMDYIKRFSAQIFVNGFFAVDAFFLIGGFLQCYLRVLRQKGSSKKEPSYFVMIFLRIWRIAPIYCFSILLMYLMEKRAPGFPFFKKEIYSNHWWKNILFINNFYYPKYTYFQPSWYISADLQLFVGSLLVVGLLIKSPKKGMIASLVILMLGIVSGVLWVYFLKGPPTALFSIISEEMIEAFSLSLTGPFCHIAPYFSGIIIGFVVATYKDIKLPKVLQAVGWPLAAVCSASFVFSSVAWNRGAGFTRVGAALYFTLGRFFYPCGIAWVIFCCVTGHGGIVNYLLSMKVWIPLSRISFAAYLVSMMVQFFSFMSRRYVADVDERFIVWEWIVDSVLTLLIAFPMTIIFESPSIALQKLIFFKERKEAAPPNKTVHGFENGGFIAKDNHMESSSNGKATSKV